MDSNKFQKHVLATYFSLRFGIGCLAIGLPIILWTVSNLIGDPAQQSSISAYYHTSLRDVFVGMLCATGICLHLYKGYSSGENYALNAAGIFALGVAFMPTSEIRGVVTMQSFGHGVCAILFFLATAYVCIFEAHNTLGDIADSKIRGRYRMIYNFLGSMMVVLPLTTAFYISVLDLRSMLIFWIEVAATAVFGAYWFTKSVELSRTANDHRALQKAYAEMEQEEKATGNESGLAQQI